MKVIIRVCCTKWFFFYILNWKLISAHSTCLNWYLNNCLSFNSKECRIFNKKKLCTSTATTWKLYIRYESISMHLYCIFEWISLSNGNNSMLFINKCSAFNVDDDVEEKVFRCSTYIYLCCGCEFIENAHTNRQANAFSKWQKNTHTRISIFLFNVKQSIYIRFFHAFVIQSMFRSLIFRAVFRRMHLIEMEEEEEWWKRHIRNHILIKRKFNNF